MQDYSSVQKKIMMDRAHSAVLSRDYQLGARLYKGLLQNDPENIELLSALGDLYERSGKDFESIPFYKNIVTLDPENVNALNSLGAIYRRLGRFDESIDVLQKALIADESNIQIFYNLGSTYNLKGRLDNAIYCFTKVIEAKPDDVLAYNHLGHVYAKQKIYDKAISTYIQGLKIDPNHPILHLNLAKCYDKIGSKDKASLEYENAMRYKPGWNDAIESYSDFLIRNNCSEKAKKLVGHAIKLNSGNIQMHNKMGDVYAHQHDFSNAENEFKFVLDKKDDNKNALKGLASVYEADDKMVEAIHTMRLMEKNYPNDTNMLEQYAHVLLSAGKMNSASKKIKELWDKNQKDEALLNLLSQYYVLKGDEGKALGCFKRIESLNPFYKEHLKDCAFRYAQIGNFEKALSYGEKYLNEYPDDLKALLGVAKCLEALGRNDEAVEKYKNLIQKDECNLEYKSGLERLMKDEAPIVEESEENVQEKAPEIIDGVEVDENIEDFAENLNDESELTLDDENEINVNSDDSASEDNLEYKESEFSFEKLAEDDSDIKSVFKKLDDEIRANGSIEDDEFGENLDDLVDKDLDDNFFSTYPKDKSGVPDIEEIDDGFDGNASFEKEDIYDDLGLDQGNYYEVCDGMKDELNNEMESTGFDVVKDGLDNSQVNNDYIPVSSNGTNQESFNLPDDIEEIEEIDDGLSFNIPLEGDDLALSEEEAVQIDNIALNDEENNLEDFEEAVAEPSGMQGDSVALDDEENNLADFGDIKDITEGSNDLISDEENQVDVVEKVIGAMEEEAALENDNIALGDEENNLADFEEAIAEPSGIQGDSVALNDEENNLADFEEAIAEPSGIQGDSVALNDEENNLIDFENMEEISIEDEEEERPDPELLFDRAAETLDELANEMPDEGTAEKFSLVAKLFLELKALSNYLPPDKKKAFFESKEQLELEYIIGRLSGKRGLLATAQAIRRKLGISDDLDKVTATGEELVKAVFTYMKSMIRALPDINVAENLDHHMDNAIHAI